MNWSTQLYLSSDHKKKYSLRDLEIKLTPILQSPGLTRLLFWNTLDDVYTKLILELCQEHEIECWLWYPVLADTHISPDVHGTQMSINHKGQMGVCEPGCMELSGEGEEEFSFICPSDAGFEDKTEAHLVDLLDRYAFDGVFLDRIRFPSFANGLPLFFSCLCPECCLRMELDRDLLVQEIESLTGEDYLKLFSGLNRGGTQQEFPHIHDFLKKRADLITDKAGKLIRIARDKDRGAALDLFSPSLSAAVGQNYRDLSSMVDWIKPMTYAKAWGPAGIPLELDCLFKGIKESFPHLLDNTIIKALEEMMNFDLETHWEGKNRTGFPLELASQEWEDAVARGAASSPSACSFYPGIEFIHSELFQTKVSEQDAAAVVRQFREKAEIIACWNCLEIPEAYFSLLDQG